MDLVASTYKIASRLPHTERYALASQLRRASISVPANIAEGWGRRGLGDYIHHLHIANGSLKDLETELLLAHRLGYMEASGLQQPLDLTDQVGRLLGALIRSLKKKRMSPKS